MSSFLGLQHETAYTVAGVLVARGYSPRVEISGGGILQVFAPIALHGTADRYAIRFSSYVDDAVDVIDTDDDDATALWYLPSLVLNPYERVSEQVMDFLNELQNELTNGENN